MSERTFFEGLKAYVGFTDADARALRALAPCAAPRFRALAERFYERILTDPDARTVITGGPAQVERLKATLVDWMESGLQGPHDEAFHARRARIGRVHVDIDLPQRFMLTAMNGVRLDLHDLVSECVADPAARRAAHDAVDRLLDLELAIMLETYREDSQARLRRRERLATLGQVAAGIGHDLRNPLGVIASSLFLLRKRIGDEPRLTRHLDRIASQVDTSNRIIEGLLEIARDRPLRTRSTPLGPVVAEAVARAHLSPEVDVSVDLARVEDVQADPELLSQALVNLLVNAAQAQGGRGRVQVTAEAGSGEVRLLVHDGGPGFDPGTLPHAFEPLVTTRQQGSGLGLALVQSIARRHGGRVEAGNHPEGGAVVTLHLPDAPERAAETK